MFRIIKHNYQKCTSKQIKLLLYKVFIILIGKKLFKPPLKNKNGLCTAKSGTKSIHHQSLYLLIC